MRTQPVDKVQVEARNIVYKESHIQEEAKAELLSDELQQWIKKIKSTQIELEYCTKSSFGCLNEEVVSGAKSYEPYPDTERESFSYKGGKDDRKRLHGSGSLRFSQDGSTMAGTWSHGRREGQIKIETNRQGILRIEGDYCKGKMNGKVKIKFENNTWLEGFFKNGVVHGFCRYFDIEDNLTFAGMHKNGTPTGTCWKFHPDGGCVVGKVDIDGKLTGSDVSYIYPDYMTCLFGSFRDLQLVSAQQCQIIKVITESGCIKVPKFSKPKGRLYKREISTFDFVTSSPTLRDPYEESVVEVRRSKLPGAEDGVFAKRFIKEETNVAFYQGIKLPPNYKEEESWEGNAYKIFDPSNSPEGTLDIREEHRSISAYSASLAHKTNHSFNPNSQFHVFDHPRWGLVPCIVSTQDIQEGGEIFVRYGYDLSYCPEWYAEVWERGRIWTGFDKLLLCFIYRIQRRRRTLNTSEIFL